MEGPQPSASCPRATKAKVSPSPPKEGSESGHLRPKVRQSLHISRRGGGTKIQTWTASKFGLCPDGKW